MDLTNLPWLGIAAGTVASLVLGFLWYGPLFGKKWQAEVGISDEEIQKSNMFKTLGLSLILTFITGVCLAYLIPEDSDWVHSAGLGVFIGVGFVATSIGTNYLYQRRSLRLWFIDTFYRILSLGAMGALIALL